MWPSVRPVMPGTTNSGANVDAVLGKDGRGQNWLPMGIHPKEFHDSMLIGLACGHIKHHLFASIGWDHSGYILAEIFSIMPDPRGGGNLYDISGVCADVCRGWNRPAFLSLLWRGRRRFLRTSANV